MGRGSCACWGSRAWGGLGPGGSLLGGTGILWGPGPHLRKHFRGGITSVYLRVGRGSGRPVMINSKPSQRMRPPLHKGALFPSQLPTRSWGCGSAHGTGQTLSPTPPQGWPATAPSPCSHLRLHPPTAWGCCQQCPPKPGECVRCNPRGGCLRGPLSEAAPPYPVPSGTEGRPLPGASGGVGPLHLLQVLYKASAAKPPVPAPQSAAHTAS